MMPAGSDQALQPAVSLAELSPPAVTFHVITIGILIKHRNSVLCEIPTDTLAVSRLCIILADNYLIVCQDSTGVEQAIGRLEAVTYVQQYLGGIPAGSDPVCDGKGYVGCLLRAYSQIVFGTGSHCTAVGHQFP